MGQDAVEKYKFIPMAWRGKKDAGIPGEQWT
jgi:hypothetical protein